MKVSISLKTTLIIQASIVVSLIPVDILLGHLSPPEDVMSAYILFVVSIYTLLLAFTYEDLFKNNKNKDLNIK